MTIRIPSWLPNILKGMLLGYLILWGYHQKTTWDAMENAINDIYWADYLQYQQNQKLYGAVKAYTKQCQEDIQRLENHVIDADMAIRVGIVNTRLRRLLEKHGIDATKEGAYK